MLNWYVLFFFCFFYSISTNNFDQTLYTGHVAVVTKFLAAHYVEHNSVMSIFEYIQEITQKTCHVTAVIQIKLKSSMLLSNCH